MKAISIPSPARPTRRDNTESPIPKVSVHFAMLKGIAKNAKPAPEGLIRNRVKLAIQGELLTDELDHERSCQSLCYCSALLGLVSVGQLDGETIPKRC